MIPCTGNDSLAELLIKNGVNTSIVDNKGNTALHLAADNGNERIVELIIGGPAAIKNGTRTISTESNISNIPNKIISESLPFKNRLNDNLRNSLKRTPLHVAAEKGNMKITKMLIENCASLNLRERINLRTALHFAAEADHKDIVELLLKYGADTKIGDEYGSTAAKTAEVYDNDEIAALLKKSGTLPDERNCFALHEFVSKGDIKTTKELLKTEDINRIDNYGNTPLLLAIKSENQEMVDFLIKHGANVNVRDDDEATALHRAIEKNNAKISELLIKNGADVNTRDQYTCTPLMRAAEHGHEAIVKLLLENGANKHEEDRFYTSADGWADSRGYKSIGKLIRDWNSSSER